MKPRAGSRAGFLLTRPPEPAEQHEPLLKLPESDKVHRIVDGRKRGHGGRGFLGGLVHQDGAAPARTLSFDCLVQKIEEAEETREELKRVVELRFIKFN